MRELSASVLARIGVDWISLKTFIEQSFAISHDALHVIAGVVLQLLLAAGLRRSMAHPTPWLIVLVLELVNELNDLHAGTWPDTARQAGEAVKDLSLTMFLPTLLLFLSRRYPRLMRKEP